MAIGRSATATATGIKAEQATSPSLRMDISPGAERLFSPDAFRGWTMFWIVGDRRWSSDYRHATPIS